MAISVLMPRQGDSSKADELTKMHIENVLKNILTHEIKNEL